MQGHGDHLHHTGNITPSVLCVVFVFILVDLWMSDNHVGSAYM